MKYYFEHRGKVHMIDLQASEQTYSLMGAEGPQQVEPGLVTEKQVVFKVDGVEKQARCFADGRKIWLHIDGRTYLLQRRAGLDRDSATDASSDRILRAPMPGLVNEVAVNLDQKVQEGDLLLVMEAMKMELRIEAPFSNARVLAIIEKGVSVEKDQILVELEPEEDKR
jgi:3-methylcrotonyl-CoA carboxylase alpha subunit